ncbi:MAG TPA: hypothetical protein VK604_23610 [Bryobacteraceae bacterium]|nr:hypothetical protein [Bryobacteraceae bacterium]
MTIQITRPEVEALINQRLQTGGFKDAEDVVFQALQSLPPNTATAQTGPALAKDMVELFAPLRGLNLDFERDRPRHRDIRSDLKCKTPGSSGT